MKKKLLTVSAMSVIIAASFAANAGYWDYKVYNYLDANGQVVGNYYKPCFNRPGVIIGQSTATKVLVETGTCR